LIYVTIVLSTAEPTHALKAESAECTPYR